MAHGGFRPPGAAEWSTLNAVEGETTTKAAGKELKRPCATINVDVDFKFLIPTPPPPFRNVYSRPAVGVYKRRWWPGHGKGVASERGFSPTSIVWRRFDVSVRGAALCLPDGRPAVPDLDPQPTPNPKPASELEVAVFLDW